MATRRYKSKKRIGRNISDNCVLYHFSFLFGRCNSSNLKDTYY